MQSPAPRIGRPAVPSLYYHDSSSRMLLYQHPSIQRRLETWAEACRRSLATKYVRTASRRAPREVVPRPNEETRRKAPEGRAGPSSASLFFLYPCSIHRRRGGVTVSRRRAATERPDESPAKVTRPAVPTAWRMTNKPLYSCCTWNTNHDTDRASPRAPRIDSTLAFSSRSDVSSAGGCRRGADAHRGPHLRARVPRTSCVVSADP